MPTIKRILETHPPSVTQLAARSDGAYVVGLMLHEGMNHKEQEFVDFYVGFDRDAASAVFQHLTKSHRNDTIDDSPPPEYSK